MAYTIKLTNGTLLVELDEGYKDTTTSSLTLVGKNATSFGQAFNENFIHALENFSNGTPPEAPVEGQLWWDSVNKHLLVYQGSVWKVISASQTGSSSPVLPIIGDFWWDTVTSTFKVYNGSAWISVGPFIPPGMASTTIAGNSVVSSSPVSTYNIGNLLVNGKLAAIISTEFNTTFTPTLPISGITKVYPGLNFVAGLESTMITSPNMTMGVSSGNVTINSLTSGNGFNLIANVAGTSTRVISISGLDGLATVAGNPTDDLGIVTKQYADSLTSGLAGDLTAANVAYKLYVDNQVATINTDMAAANAAAQSYTNTAVANLVNSAPATLDTLKELATSLGNDANFATTVTNNLATKAPVLSPTFTGTPTAPTPSVATNNTQLATTEFVRNLLPTGMITMWYGSIATIPAGWALCNGTNGTPDLRDRFVVGAGSLYTPGSTGGSKDAVVVSHSHTATSTSTVTDPGHTHRLQRSTNGSWGSQDYPSANQANYNMGSFGTDAAYTGISVSTSTSVASSGVSGTNANLPPYYALCYIMKL